MIGVARALALSLAALLIAAAADAHRGGESHLELSVNAERISGHWEIGLHDLARAEPGAAELGDLAAARTWLATRPELAAQLVSRLELRADGETCPLAGPFTAELAERSGTLQLVLDVSARCTRPPRQLTVSYRLLFDTDRSHQGLLKLHAGSLVRPAVFSANSQEQSFTLRQDNAWERGAADLRSGLWHIWTGPDHLLFLICLLLPAVLVHNTFSGGALRSVLVDVTQVVTAFTVAHSVTLAAGALHLVSLPARFTESTIAASVVVAAALNVRPVRHVRRWHAAFGFGLIHGFGFASAIEELGVTTAGLIPTLLAFNMGIEVGQLAVVIALLPLAYVVRDRAWYRPVVVRNGSVVIAAIALLWLIERAFDLSFLPVR
jgi:hypothetical protein